LIHFFKRLLKVTTKKKCMENPKAKFWRQRQI